jgi:indoleacetamide hydrolase
VHRREFLSQSAAALGVLAAAQSARAKPASAELTDLSATEAVRGMRDGDFKAEAYAAALLAQASRFTRLNAFRVLPSEAILEAARAADKRRAAGQALGQLHGLPIPVKDSVNTVALPTTNGTRALQNFHPKADAAVLQPLFAQGAILMGKTNLHELSCGWTSNNLTFGPVLNPYDPGRTPGGSSGGSAAAVAARIAPLAIGEDTYGSIRVPSTFCGLSGLRPTYERYPDEGLMPLASHKFDQVGPLARTVRDLALFDAVQTGATAPLRPLSLKQARIAISPQYSCEGIDPECGRIFDAAIRKLKHAGATIVEAELPESVHPASDVERAILGYELLGSLRQFLQSQDTGVSLDELIAQAGKNLAPLLAASRDPGPWARYEQLLEQMRQIRAATLDYFRAYRLDALAFPPTLMPAFPQGDAPTVSIGGRQVDLFTAIGRNIALGSFTGLSCLVLPAGMTQSGLPVGIELDALPGSDRRLLSLGMSVERVLGPVPPPASIRTSASAARRQS